MLEASGGSTAASYGTDNPPSTLPGAFPPASIAAVCEPATPVGSVRG
jgi:hypothetical protein